MSSTLSSPEIQLNSDLAKVISESVIETIGTLTGVKPVALKPETGLGLAVHADISGLVSMIQDRVEGTLIMSFPKETIFQILVFIYRQKFTEINTSVQQGVAEFTNIIYGMAKTNLNASGYRLKMAIPHVIMGDQHKVVNTINQPVMILPFQFGNQYPFHAILQVHHHTTKEGK